MKYLHYDCGCKYYPYSKEGNTEECDDNHLDVTEEGPVCSQCGDVHPVCFAEEVTLREE